MHLPIVPLKSAAICTLIMIFGGFLTWGYSGGTTQQWSNRCALATMLAMIGLFVSLIWVICAA